MAATLTVDQAVQRLVHRSPRTTAANGESMSVAPSLQALEIDHQRNLSNNSAVMVGGRRNGNQLNNFMDDRYSLANNRLQPFSNSPLLHGQQTGKNNKAATNSNGNDTMNGQNGIPNISGAVATTNSVDKVQYLQSVIGAQVNVIKKQQHYLAAKEREVDDLRRENEALKMTLRSMQRRLQESSASTAPAPAQQHQDSPKLEAPINSSAPNTTTIVKSEADSTSANIITQTKSHPAVKSERSKPTKPKQRAQTRRSKQVNGPLPNMEEPQKTATIVGKLRSGRRRTAEEPPAETQSKKRARQESVDVGEVDNDGSRVTRQRLQQSVKKDKSSNQKQDFVQTPGWRLFPFTVAGVLEGTENITDEALANRHKKCETEERRIIRRDQMRQREEMLKEKLLHQRNAKRKREKTDSESTSSTTQPDVNQLEAIEVCAKLPNGKETETKLPQNADTPQPAMNGKKLKKK